MALIGSDPLPHHVPPGRIAAAALGEQRTPGLDSGRELAVLLLGDGNEDARLDEVGIELGGPRQRAAGIFAHHAVIGEHQRLPIAGQPLRRFAEQAARLGIGVSRVGVAAPRHIDRCDDLPPLTVLWVLAQSRLDTGDECRKVLVACGVLQTGSQRLVGQAGGAIGEVEPERERREKCRNADHHRTGG